MNIEERQKFWETLCSFTGEQIENEIKILKSSIRYPKYLFRYRSVNNNNLEALRTNKIFFSKASKYDDPFDTFLNIDINRFQSEFENVFKDFKKIDKVVNAVRMLSELGHIEIQEGLIDKIMLPDNGYRNDLENQFLSYALNFRTKIQDNIQSICFSENGYNETLWLKYADMHKGFVQIYDLEKAENFHCGKYEKCKNCGISRYGLSLYPICYSDTPYNATEFVKNIMGKEMLENAGPQVSSYLKEEFSIKTWEIERCSLIKKTCHMYDEEWRIISNCQMKEPAIMEWIPDAVILGLRTSKVDENLIISMAKEAGIEKIYKSYIDEKNKLNALLIKNT